MQRCISTIGTSLFDMFVSSASDVISSMNGSTICSETQAVKSDGVRAEKSRQEHETPFVIEKRLLGMRKDAL